MSGYFDSTLDSHKLQHPTPTNNRITKFFNVQSLLWLALILALSGSLKHLAAIFASIDGNVFMGFLQAVAIDAGLFALAYSIKVRKVANRSTKPLWFGVILFSGISIYGNLAYGLLAVDEILPHWIVVTRPYILAGSLPILVLFLSELLSDDRQHAEAKRREEQIDIQDSKIATKTARVAELERILNQNPKTTNSELATLLGVSRATIRNYKTELAISDNGRVAQ